MCSGPQGRAGHGHTARSPRLQLQKRVPRGSEVRTPRTTAPARVVSGAAAPCFQEGPPGGDRCCVLTWWGELTPSSMGKVKAPGPGGPVTSAASLLAVLLPGCGRTATLSHAGADGDHAALSSSDPRAALHSPHPTATASGPRARGQPREAALSEGAGSSELFQPGATAAHCAHYFQAQCAADTAASPLLAETQVMQGFRFCLNCNSK